MYVNNHLRNLTETRNAELLARKAPTFSSSDTWHEP